MAQGGDSNGCSEPGQPAEVLKVQKVEPGSKASVLRQEEGPARCDDTLEDSDRNPGSTSARCLPASTSFKLGSDFTFGDDQKGYRTRIVADSTCRRNWTHGTATYDYNIRHEASFWVSSKADDETTGPEPDDQFGLLGSGAVGPVLASIAETGVEP